MADRSCCSAARGWSTRRAATTPSRTSDVRDGVGRARDRPGAASAEVLDATGSSSLRASWTCTRTSASRGSSTGDGGDRDPVRPVGRGSPPCRRWRTRTPSPRRVRDRRGPGGGQSRPGRRLPRGGDHEGLEGEVLAEIGEMVQAGVRVFSDDGRCVRRRARPQRPHVRARVRRRGDRGALRGPVALGRPADARGITSYSWAWPGSRRRRRRRSSSATSRWRGSRADASTSATSRPRDRSSSFAARRPTGSA